MCCSKEKEVENVMKKKREVEMEWRGGNAFYMPKKLN